MQLAAQFTQEDLDFLDIQPFEPPEPVLSKILEPAVERAPDDRMFVDNQRHGPPTLPTTQPDCQFGGSIIVCIPVTRYVGQVDSANTLVRTGTRTRGILSRRASLVIAAFDVDRVQPCIDAGRTGFDDRGNPLAPTEFEDHEVLLNGQSVGVRKGLELEGSNMTWSATEIEVPIEILKFPVPGSDGAAPMAAMNTVQINIDTRGEGFYTSVAWAALHFKTVSPLILAHGNNSDPGFFDRQAARIPIAERPRSRKRRGFRRSRGYRQVATLR